MDDIRPYGEVLDITWLTMAIALPGIFFNLVGGVVADRLEPKYLVAGARAISATVVAFLATLVLAGGVEPWHLFVTAGVIGGVQAVAQPSRSSIFPSLATPPASMAILLGTGISHSLYITGGLAVLQNLVPDQLRGRVMALSSSSVVNDSAQGISTGGPLV